MLVVNPVPAFSDNYIWLITHQASGHTAIVDPGDAMPVLDRIKSDGLIPSAILITHHHGDHVGGIREILAHHDIPVYGPAKERIPGRTHALKEGDTVSLPGLSTQFHIFDVPGHTAGAIAYYTEGMVFVGDTLFISGCGRLFEGTAAQMYQSLNKLAQLPDDTQIYCAHEYTLGNLSFAQAVEPNNIDIQKRISECQSRRQHNTPTVPGALAMEKLTNPFLRAHNAEVRAAASNYSGGRLTDGVEVFATLRRWKDSF